MSYLVYAQNVRNTDVQALYNAALRMFGNPADGDMLYDFLLFCQDNNLIVFSINSKDEFGDVNIDSPQTLQVYTDWLSKQLCRRWQSASDYLEKNYVAVSSESK